MCDLHFIGIDDDGSAYGKSEAEAEALFKSFHHALTDVVELDDVPLGKLKILMGVKDYRFG